MKESIKKKLEETLMNTLDEGTKWAFGTDEREAALKEADMLLNHLQKDDEKERKKEGDSWEKVVEIAKIVVPVTVPLLAYNVFQKRVIKFEETGRLVSFAARDLHLPKIFK